MKRRTFVKNTTLLAAGSGLSEIAAMASWQAAENKLPKWKGFNLLDFFSPDPKPTSKPTNEDHFRWMRDWGFDFVRIPIAYPYYLTFDHSRNITPAEVYNINEAAVDRIVRLVDMAHKYNMHVSLNLHRAPGICGQTRRRRKHFTFTGLCGLNVLKIYLQKK